MEHRKVQIKLTDNRQMSNERPALMDICTRTQNRHGIWKWMRKLGVYWASDLVDTTGMI